MVVKLEREIFLKLGEHLPQDCGFAATREEPGVFEQHGGGAQTDTPPASMINAR
jgi:hypothetical protein